MTFESVKFRTLQQNGPEGWTTSGGAGAAMIK